jgi:Staphylococcal nuclease homologue
MAVSPCTELERSLRCKDCSAVPHPVTCSPTGQDQYGRTVAVCHLGSPGPDLGQWLVSNGRALDWQQYSKGKYEAAQQGAEKAGRGIWSGNFVEPWKYRACKPLHPAKGAEVGTGVGTGAQSGNKYHYISWTYYMIAAPARAPIDVRQRPEMGCLLLDI